MNIVKVVETIERANTTIYKILGTEEEGKYKVGIHMRKENNISFDENDLEENGCRLIRVVCIANEKGNDFKRTYIRYKKLGSDEYTEIDF